MANRVKAPLRKGSHQPGIVPSPYRTMKSGMASGPPVAIAASSLRCIAIA